MLLVIFYLFIFQIFLYSRHSSLYYLFIMHSVNNLLSVYCVQALGVLRWMWCSPYPPRVDHLLWEMREFVSNTLCPSLLASTPRIFRSLGSFYKTHFHSFCWNGGWGGRRNEGFCSKCRLPLTSWLLRTSVVEEEGPLWDRFHVAWSEESGSGSCWSWYWQ